MSTLMDVSRLEAGRLKGSFRLVNLGAMTRDLAVGRVKAGTEAVLTLPPGPVWGSYPESKIGIRDRL